ncbi:hypothetical protein R1sor_003410 [Riccia sorocarpa]|uniref:Uncharacterized protein n=1 Tax=Riccia sorocarpa TaxID=122646 RepID=A0ABD3H2C7_9MARC
MLHKTHLSDRLQTIWAQARHTADYWEEETRRWLAGATKREPRSQHRSPSPQASPDREANNATDPPFHASTGWNDNEMIRWDARENSRCNEAPTMGPTNAIRREPSPDRMAEWSVLDKTDLARRLTSALDTWTFHPTSSAHVTSGTNQQPPPELRHETETTPTALHRWSWQSWPKTGLNPVTFRDFPAACKHARVTVPWWTHELVGSESMARLLDVPRPRGILREDVHSLIISFLLAKERRGVERLAWGLERLASGF